jgi:Tfp pilus assembly protein FimT
MGTGGIFRDRRGYSIGELLWVIVILSIIAALVIPKLDWMRFRLNSEHRNVQMQLAYAQRLAVTLQHNVQVTIDHPLRRLIVVEDANNDGTFAATERRRMIQLDDGINFERVSAPDLPAPAPTTEVTQIVFRRDGSADQAGVIFVNTTRAVALATNDDVRALEIVRATGRALAYRYLSSTWVKSW